MFRSLAAAALAALAVGCTHRVELDTSRPAEVNLGKATDTVLLVVPPGPDAAAVASGLERSLGRAYTVARFDAKPGVRVDRDTAPVPALHRCERLGCDAIVVLEAPPADEKPVALARVFRRDGTLRLGELRVAAPESVRGRHHVAFAAGAALGRDALPIGGLVARDLYASGSPELREAWAAARDGRWRKATRLWESVAAQGDPTDAARAFANLSVSHERAGDLEAARQAAAEAYDLLGTDRTAARLSELDAAPDARPAWGEDLEDPVDAER